MYCTQRWIFGKKQGLERPKRDAKAGRHKARNPIGEERT
jgi:hypothetical protein